MNLILLILVLMLIFGGLPQVGFVQYGYAPSGLGLVLLILLLVFAFGGGRQLGP